MSFARRLDGLTFFTAADLKAIVSVIGLDLTGVTGTCDLALVPGGPVIASPTVTMLSVSTDDDGVPTSMVQIRLPKSTVQSLAASLPTGEPGGDVRIFYEFRLSAFPGDIGTAGPASFFYGTGIIKASI
jgi:hypothetical protein